MDVLIAAGIAETHSVLRDLFSARGDTHRLVASAPALLEAYRASPAPLVVVDWSLIDDGAALLGELGALAGDVPPFVVALVDIAKVASGVSLASLLAAGVGDFVVLPLRADVLDARLRVVEERLRKEAAIRESEEKFRSMVANIPGAVFRSVADDEGHELAKRRTTRRIDFISDYVEKLVGYPPRAFLEQNLAYSSLVHPDDAERVAREVERAFEERRPYDLEYRMVGADGDIRWVSSRGRAQFDAAGVFRFLDGAIFDITTEKRAREALAEANEALRLLHEQKERMFQNVTHELRTPLTLILSPLERMLERGIEGEDRARLEAMHRNALRLLGLISDMLDLAKLDSTKLVVMARPLDVVHFVRRLVADALPAAEAKGLYVRVHAADAEAIYRLDPTHLERILLNLLSNAFKFTPRGGTVAVSIADGDAGGGLSIAVQDTGIGISEEARAQLFHRFEQIDDRAVREHGGTGIGLALALELTKLMGGEITVESAPGVGTTFAVRFPSSRRVGREEETPLDSGPAPTLARRAALAALAAETDAVVRRRGGTRGPLVLVAEDDPGISEELYDLLVPHYRVTTVADGEEALAAAIETTPHVIISDVMMPRMDGLALTAALRERTAFRDTPIVLLSARGELDDRVRGRQLGVDTYLPKPFHPRELLATIEGLLRSRMRVVGSFLLQQRLGSGAQGTVWLAEHLTSGAVAALKLIDARADDTQTRIFLKREQQSLSRVRHPNVVSIFEQGVHQNHLYVAMEYLDGSTLQSVLAKNGALPPAAVKGIAHAVSEALEAVHHEGLLHRDIKPSNIMLLKGWTPLRERVRLIDFGTALEAGTAKREKMLVGSLHYLAPELLLGGTPSVASDIYALGVSMFTLSAAEWPHRASDPVDLLESMRTSQPSVRDRAPHFPQALEHILLRAMAFEAEERWTSAAELARALDELDLGPEEMAPSPVSTGTLEVPTLAAPQADVAEAGVRRTTVS